MPRNLVLFDLEWNIGYQLWVLLERFYMHQLKMLSNEK